ncbi:MAG: phage terminase large subunit, partial [Bacteroidales bacterium]
VIIDDIDDDELSRNPRRVKQAFEWVMTALYGAMDAGRGRFVLVGNRISQCSVLAEFAKATEVHHVTVNILDKHGNPSWKENHTIEEINLIRSRIGERKFMKEFMNAPIIEGTIFDEKYFKWGKMLKPEEYSCLISYTDPSFKSTSKNDYKATILLGKTKCGYFHVIKAYVDQTTVSEMVRWHYCIREQVGDARRVKFYMESNFMQDLLLDEFRKEGEQRGDHIPIVGDKRKKIDKGARIEALQPHFERGLIIFNETERSDLGMRTLIEQLVGFEKGGKMHDDGPDALEGAIELASKRARKSKTTYLAGGRSFSCR